MKFTINIDELKTKIPLLKRSLKSSSSLPILEGIYLKAQGETVEVRATDLYFGVKFILKAEVEKPGETVIRAQQFIELINSIKQTKSLNFHKQSKEPTILLSNKTISVKLPTYNPKDFPVFPNLKSQSYLISLSRLKFINEYIVSNASNDLTRPILTGVLFNFNQDYLEVATTDGYRLAVKKFKNESQIFGKIIIPAKIIQELEKTILEEELSELILEVDQEQFQAKCVIGNVEIFIRLIEGEYPPYHKIIPNQFNLVCKLSALDLLPHLKQAKIFARNNSNIVQLKINHKQIEVFANSLSMGSYTSIVKPTNISGDEFNLAFNVDYLIDFLQKAGENEVKIEAVESLKPAKLTINGLNQLTYIIMPIKVHS